MFSGIFLGIYTETRALLVKVHLQQFSFFILWFFVLFWRLYNNLGFCMYACWFCHISRFDRFLFLGLFCTSNQNMLLLEMLEIYMLSCKWIKKKKKK
jgi:hypothetical protein